MRHLHFASVTALTAVVTSVVTAQTVIYSDNFGAASAANWTVQGSNTDGGNDFQAEFGFDISTRSLPNSPSGDNIVLRTVANIAAPAGREAVTAFLTGFPVTPEIYSIEVEVYCAFAPPGGGTGTTRAAAVGIEHSAPPLGPVHTREGGDPAPYQPAANGNGQDGLVFSYNTDDDDAASCFFLLEGNYGTPLNNLVTSGTWADPAGTTPNAQFARDPFYQAIIPANPNDGDPAAELMGNQWCPVTITNINGNISVEIFGTAIVTHTFAGITDGLVSLTNERPFTSVTPSPLLSECYFDNLVITDLTPEITAAREWNFYH